MPDLSIPWNEGLLWLGGSLLLAALWTNLSWHFRLPRPGAVGEFVTRLTTWRLSPWLLHFLRLLYYVGIPSAALYWGHDAVLRQYLGLPGPDRWLDWAQDIGRAVALGVGMWILLLASWLIYRRALATTTDTGLAGEGVTGWVLLREAAFHEIHWAFYRNAPIVAMLRRAGDAYWGVWIGLALVTLEAALNPAWRKGLGEPHKAPAQLVRGALAVASSVLFLVNENLWLALAVHWGVSWGLAALVRAFPLSQIKPTQRSEQPAPPVPLRQ